MRFFYLSGAVLLFGVACAVPLLQDRDQQASAASLILQVSPNSASCSGAPFPSECRTANQAAPYIIQGMQEYGLYTYGEIAAVLSVIAYESGDFKYNINHYPGTPGQGTRNMQMPNFNLEYAQSIPNLTAQVSAITTSTSTTGLSDDQLNDILNLVTPDQYSFASGAWFVATQCSADIRAGLQAGTQVGFTNYVSECIGTSPDGRLDYWNRAQTAFGLPG